MAQSAHLTSIEAVSTLSAALKRFGRDTTAALEELALQAERALEWISQDRRMFWAHEVRRASEQVTEAKINLQNAQTLRRVGDYRPSCVEEKKALQKAQFRLQTARDKVELVRHWTREVERAVLKYKGGVGALSRWLDVDLQHALAALEKMTTALEAYIAVAPVAVSDPNAAPASRKAPVAEPAESTDDEPKAETPEEPSPESAEASPAAGEGVSRGADANNPDREARP